MQAVQNASASQGRVHIQSTVSLEEPPPLKHSEVRKTMQSKTTGKASTKQAATC